MAAPIPSPQYIDLSNVELLISPDKVIVSDAEPNAISIAAANMIIAKAEGDVLLDLNPYYITNPALITVTGGAWTTLENTYPTTYRALYDAFTWKACSLLLDNYIQRNSKDFNDSQLYTYKVNYEKQYLDFLNRLLNLLPNGAYKFQLEGLKTKVDGILRTPKVYAIAGKLSGVNFVERHLTDPSKNWMGFLPGSRRCRK